MSWTRTQGKNSTPPRDPTDPLRRRANKHKGHGTDAKDRPPIISILSRDTGEQRLWVCDHADRQTCHALMADNVPSGSPLLDTDEWPSDRGSHPRQTTVSHDRRDWAQEDHGDGQREPHGHTCEGAGAALRTDLRAFRGVHQPYLHLYVATCEGMAKAKRVTPALIQRMCVGNMSMHTGYT
jgi:transposase